MFYLFIEREQEGKKREKKNKVSWYYCYIYVSIQLFFKNICLFFFANLFIRCSMNNVFLNNLFLTYLSIFNTWMQLETRKIYFEGKFVPTIMEIHINIPRYYATRIDIDMERSESTKHE